MATGHEESCWQGSVESGLRVLDQAVCAQAAKPVPPEIAKLVSWIDTDGDGEIDVVEFEAAIRRFRRLTNAKAVAKEREGRDIMLKLAAKMGEQRLTARQFFDEMDESGDGLVAGYELRRGLVGKQLVGKLEATQVGLWLMHSWLGEGVWAGVPLHGPEC